MRVKSYPQGSFFFVIQGISHSGSRSAAEAEAAHEEAALAKRQLRQAQQAARTALERLEAESLQRQRAETKVVAA